MCSENVFHTLYHVSRIRLLQENGVKPTRITIDHHHLISQEDQLRFLVRAQRTDCLTSRVLVSP